MISSILPLTPATTAASTAAAVTARISNFGSCAVDCVRVVVADGIANVPDTIVSQRGLSPIEILRLIAL